jgi:hypothetical protein
MWFDGRVIARRALVAAVALIVAWGSAAAPVVEAADPVVVGAGDIADCSSTADSATATLIDGIAGTVITLGDNAYDSGTAAQFRDCYGPTWGRHKARTRPSTGNHDYGTSGAAGYFGYFGTAAGDPAKGYYSYDRGTWHLVVLNSNCGAVGGCGATSAQVRWLKADLAAHASANVLAYWHHPRFSSGTHGGTTDVAAFWDVLYAAGADLVLNGHDHDYERFAPQDPATHADKSFGIREFVVGTGGKDLRSRATTAANSQAFSSTHGVLKLSLHPTSYDWKFIPVPGSSFTDSGSGSVHGAPTPFTSTTFRASSDAYVDQARPRSNFGGAASLWVDGDTGNGLDRHTYIRVRVSGLTGVVDRAVLRLWITNGTRDGPRVYPTTTTWSGRTITWRNRPGATGPAVADAGRLSAGRWASFDVTSLVRGDGSYGFLLRPTSGDGLAASSMQGAHPPRLVVRTVATAD